MTTVVFHEGKMYCDTRAMKKNRSISYQKIRKITKIHGHLFGFAGKIKKINNMINILDKDISKNKIQFIDQVACLEWDGENLFRWRRSFFGFSLIREKIGAKESFAAIGSGSSYAEKAFRKGSNPEECIKFASKHDKGTNSEILSFDIFAKIGKKLRVYNPVPVSNLYQVKVLPAANYQPYYQLNYPLWTLKKKV